MKWNHLAGVVVMLSAFVVPSPSSGMGFRCPPTPTLREDADASKVVVLAVLCQSHETKDGGTSEFHIERVLKSDPILDGKQILHVPRLFPQAPGGPSRCLLLADVFEGQLDVFRAAPVTPAAEEYLQGLLAIDRKDCSGSLRYCFDYLEHSDPVVAADAHNEFSQWTDEDIAEAAQAFAPRKLRGWLSNPKTPLVRLNLYGVLLGHCGNARDAELLARLKRKWASQTMPVMDGLLTGYVLLNPRDGWAQVRRLLQDESRDFTVRYSALRTVRYFRQTRPDIIPPSDLIAALGILLDQKDIADIAIEDLRKWQCWDLTDRILALYTRPSHDARIIRRSICRYAMQCPGAKAAAFVAEVRKRDPQLIADTEELLLLEGQSTAAAKDVQ